MGHHCDIKLWIETGTHWTTAGIISALEHTQSLLGVLRHGSLSKSGSKDFPLVEVIAQKLRLVLENWSFINENS